MRLDKYLKVSRIIKRRPVAKEVADKGRIKVNVVYMKVKVREGAYRIYRTDANYDTRRVYM